MSKNQTTLRSKKTSAKTLSQFFFWSKFLRKSSEPQRLVVLVLPFPMSVPVDPMCVVPMVTAMDWCPCCATSMRLHGMWIKVEASERDPLPCILGTQVTEHFLFSAVYKSFCFGDFNWKVKKHDESNLEIL